MNPSFETIAAAFSRTAARYDAFGEDHPHLERLRQKVYRHLAAHLPPGARLLELNAGTGTDGAELARRGYYVHATDISPGMLARARAKAALPETAQRLTVQECSFTALHKVESGPFDAVFSNLGGLNCIPDLRLVIDQLPLVLKPGGLVVWVLMPPVCLWELAEIFRGRFRVAFRRLARGGVLTHLEGLYFPVYYFRPEQVLAWFGPAYTCLAVEGLSVLTPTAESKNFAVRHPRAYRALAWLDDHLSPRRPWRGWGDFYLLAMRRRP